MVERGMMMTGKYIDWVELEREQRLDREAAVVANLNKKLGISEPKPEPEPEPNALQEENDRLREDIAMLEGQVREVANASRKMLEKATSDLLEQTANQDALIKELREALTEACRWNWLDHQSWALALDPTGSVPPRVCKQIYTALHRKV